MASTALSVSVSRFTYVPNEQFATVEAAFSAKPPAEWILVPPHASFTLAIDQTSDHVIMKCLDGQDVRVSIQLSYFHLTTYHRARGIYPLSRGRVHIILVDTS